jgi:hypothetical protein
MGDPTTTPWVIAIIALLAPVALVGMLFLGYVLSLADQ